MFIQSNLLGVFFYYCLYFQCVEVLHTVMLKRNNSSFFFLRYLYGFTFKFGSLIPLEFILGCGVRCRSNFIFTQMATQHQVLKGYLCPGDLRCQLYHIPNFHMSIGLFQGFLFYSTGLWSVCRPVPNHFNYRGFVLCFNV